MSVAVCPRSRVPTERVSPAWDESGATRRAGRAAVRYVQPPTLRLVAFYLAGLRPVHVWTERAETVLQITTRLRTFAQRDCDDGVGVATKTPNHPYIWIRHEEHMYNLLVGFSKNTAHGSRMFEYTESAILEYVRPDGALDSSRLLNLPALVMPEVGDTSSPPVARVGRITDLQRSRSDYRFTFSQAAGIPSFSTDHIAALAPDLGIGEWELHRTHWAIKAVDLYGVLLEAEGSRQLSPQVSSCQLSHSGIRISSRL